MLCLKLSMAVPIIWG